MIHISSKKFVLGCLLFAAGIFCSGFFLKLPTLLLVAEVLLTILALFVFGSIKYQIHKNAISYGALALIFATFWHVAPVGSLKISEFFSFHGLDKLIHVDTLLFIFGLTFFVAVIAQTRLLETISLGLLRKNRGKVVPTVAAIMAVVGFASGILDGVSMIGLMIRVLVMILFLAKVKDDSVLYAVMVSTIVTTVCGMWLAYGEPPNLIMKANLHPHLDDAFFLRYCLPVAVGSYFIVFFNMRKRLKGRRVKMDDMDILDRHIADVRFMQAMRHGEVLIAAEFVDEHRDLLGDRNEAVDHRLHLGEPLGLALIRENIAKKDRLKLLGLFLSENLAEDLDKYYQHLDQGDVYDNSSAVQRIRQALESAKKKRIRSQGLGFLAFMPFLGFLIGHAINHNVPLFLASFAGFAVALIGVFSIPRIRKLAFKEALHECGEYLFLIPLFFSITLLTKTGFFDQFSVLLQNGLGKMGIVVMAYLQFVGASFLSAALDNNVVADFAGRALHGFEINVLHLFAMAQIAGYAVGGCWTHIGSAQSVVAYSFIKREVDKKFTPFQWIKVMTPLILEIFALMTVVILIEAAFFY